MSGTEAELESPYWRLGDDSDQGSGGPQIVRRFSLACRAIIATVRQAGPRPAVVATALQVASGTATAFGLLATTRALEDMLASGPTGERLSASLPALVLVAATFAGRGLVDTGVASAQARLVPAVRRTAEERLFEVAASVDLATFESATFYDRMRRARERGLMHLERATENGMELIGSSLAVAAALATLVVLHPVLVPVLLASVVPHAWASLRSARLEYASMSETVALRRRVDMIANLVTKREAAPEIRANQAEAFVMGEYRVAAKALLDRDVRIGLAQVRARAAGRAMAGVGVGITYGALILLLQAGAVPLAVAGTALIAIRATTGALTRLVLAGNELLEHAIYIADYQAFLVDATARIRPAGGAAVPTAPKRISLENVGFRYPGSSDGAPALANVTLTIPGGATVALVGENGSGKTTLAKLIAGLYRPTDGRIAWDGVDVADFDPVAFADRIVMVQQEAVRWPHSARDNVRVGRHDRLDPHDEMLHEAAVRARADEVIDQLPRRWDTLLSKYFQGGYELSGGQWQRVAVARGLYRDAPVLIWDEPTAPLDAKAECAVYEALREMTNGRTVIMITHRLASVRHFDHIYLLHDGVLAEEGTHESLLAAGGRYAELYELQARVYDRSSDPLPV